MFRRSINIPRHTSILGTLTLSQTPMSANATGFGEFTGTGARVYDDRLTDDQTIPDEFADRLPGVGVGDFADLVRVEPDFALPASDHGGCKTFLSAKIDPNANERKFG